MAEARYLDKAVVQELTLLNSRAKVTYPSGDTAFPRIERIVPRNIREWQLAFLSACQAMDGENLPTGTVLTEQFKIGSDDHFARVYQLYEKIPGSVSISYREDAELGFVTIATQQVLASTATGGATTTDTTLTSYAPRGDSNIIAIKTVETWGTTPTKKGQEYDRSLGLIFPFTEREETFADPTVGAPSLGDDQTEVIPGTAHNSRVRTYDQAAVNAALATFHRASYDTIRLVLPDVLLALSVAFNVTQGSGVEGSATTFTALGDSTPIALGTPARATSSCTITAAPVMTMKQFWGAETTPAIKYNFFIHGDFTQSDLLTRLSAADLANATVHAWPNFKAQGQVLALHSAQLSLGANANIDRRGSNGVGSILTYITTKTIGNSMETGGSSPTLNIPPCIHGHISITNPTKDVTLHVEAISTLNGFAPGGPVLIPADSADASLDQHVTASITPTDLPATAPASVPTSGLYLAPNPQTRDFDSENKEVTAWVVDMSYFLSYTIAATPSTVGYGTIAGIGEFDPGATVTLVATALGGHSFVNWTEGVTVVSSSATYTFTASADRVLIAHFT